MRLYAGTVKAPSGFAGGGGTVAPPKKAKELRFAIREGGRTVGAGVISEVVE